MTNASTPGTLHTIFTPNGVETATSDDDLQAFAVEGRPVTILMSQHGVTQKFHQGNGGQTPTYKINDNATLAVYAGEELHITFGPSAWTAVRGLEKAVPRGRLRV